MGTRPEAIKMAPVIAELLRDDELLVRVCVTGQHRSMLDQVLNIFGIKPDYDLDIMRQDHTLSDVTVGVLYGIQNILREFQPDWVLVQGDTTTAFTAALGAFYQKIPVAHIEAGLRTGNIYAPWPEEMNRKLTGALSTLHFAPTDRARENLLHEGVRAESIFVTGNTVIDALLEIVQNIRHSLTLPH